MLSTGASMEFHPVRTFSLIACLSLSSYRPSFALLRGAVFIIKWKMHRFRVMGGRWRSPSRRCNLHITGLRNVEHIVGQGVFGLCLSSKWTYFTFVDGLIFCTLFFKSSLPSQGRMRGGRRRQHAWGRWLLLSSYRGSGSIVRRLSAFFVL